MWTISWYCAISKFLGVIIRTVQMLSVPESGDQSRTGLGRTCRKSLDLRGPLYFLPLKTASHLHWGSLWKPQKISSVCWMMWQKLWKSKDILLLKMGCISRPPRTEICCVGFLKDFRSSLMSWNQSVLLLIWFYRSLDKIYSEWFGRGLGHLCLFQSDFPGRVSQQLETPWARGQNSFVSWEFVRAWWAHCNYYPRHKVCRKMKM